MGKMSKDKGARGERELARMLTSLLNYESRRGQQHSGSPDSPDVVSIPGIHWEVKRTEKLMLYPSMDQASGDSGDSVPVVAHRRNFKQWLVILPFKDIIRFAEVIYEHVHGKSRD
jgi:Holliday junction resolvase